MHCMHGAMDASLTPGMVMVWLLACCCLLHCMSKFVTHQLEQSIVGEEQEERVSWRQAGRLVCAGQQDNTARRGISRMLRGRSGWSPPRRRRPLTTSGSPRRAGAGRLWICTAQCGSAGAIALACPPSAHHCESCDPYNSLARSLGSSGSLTCTPWPCRQVGHCTLASLELISAVPVCRRWQ